MPEWDSKMGRKSLEWWNWPDPQLASGVLIKCVKVQVVCSVWVCVSSWDFNPQPPDWPSGNQAWRCVFLSYSVFHQRSPSPTTQSMGFEMNTMCLNLSKVSVCERFRITKSVVAISLQKPPWSVCVCVGVGGALMNLREALAGVWRL